MPGDTSYLQTSAGLIHWKDYGGSGRLVVAVHGLGGSISNWDAIGPGLAEVGRTVALDLPGFGLSPPAGDWELSTHAAAVVSFVSELAPETTLIANSMGGLIAEMVAADHPEMVNALVLLSPATPPRFPDPRMHWPTARRLTLQALPGVGPWLTRRFIANNTPEELVRLSLEMITHAPGRVPMEVVQASVELARVRKQLPWATRAVPDTARSIARLFRRPSRFAAMIREITAPTLVVHGLADHVVSPTAVEWMCTLRPDWELVQMEDTGHTPQLDAPVRLMGILMPWLEAHQEAELSA